MGVLGAHGCKVYLRDKNIAVSYGVLNGTG